MVNTNTKHALTAAIAASRLTVREVARSLRVSTGYVYFVASGSKAPSSRVVAGLARLLGVPEHDVVAMCPLKPGKRGWPECDEARQALAAAGVSQSELARRAGTFPSAVSAYLRGAARPTRGPVPAHGPPGRPMRTRVEFGAWLRARGWAAAPDVGGILAVRRHLELDPHGNAALLKVLHPLYKEWAVEAGVPLVVGVKAEQMGDDQAAALAGLMLGASQ
jgi:transcriptional regulator with XRE-family HTH domain